MSFYLTNNHGIKKLMIDDWVFCKYPSINKPVKVASIKIIDNDELKIVVYNDNIKFTLKDEYIEPIPLTSEILKKNGFSLQKYSGNIMSGEWWTREDFCIHKSMNDSVGKNNFKYEYVHQLQHALRLCEIEKEIIL